MDARIDAANVILERGVRFRLPAPFWKRWLKKDYVTIHHLKAGTILEIAKVMIAEKLEDAVGLSGNEFLIKSVPACARCIAIAILNDAEKIERKADELTKKLIHDVSAGSVVKLFMQVAQMNRVSDFTNITRYFLTITQTMMNPKNLGREDGS